MKTAWFVVLFCSICLEGLGRKYLPSVPSIVFYFLKDVVLLIGLVRFGLPPKVSRTVRYLYRGFGIVLVVSIAWTVIQMFNPEQESLPLALVGLRSYWFWWVSPAVIAGVLLNPKHKREAIYALLIVAVGISALAAVQFASPANSSVNLYSVVDGEEIYADIAKVASTGRARVSSTFSFLTGFVAFTVLVPALLLSVGLETQDPKLRRAALIGTMATAAVVPMSGSRTSVIMGGGVLLITMWTAGLFFTRVGRRIVIGAGIATVLAGFAFPDAILGVQDRFGDQAETTERLAGLATVLPPIALATLEYPYAGIGTGMQQNARAAFKVYPKWEAELEAGRYLIELGPVGFVLVWMSKLGLMVALIRAYRILKKAGRRGSASAAVTYAALTMFGYLTFDHVWQALYFLGCGFILAEVVEVLHPRLPASEPGAPAPDAGQPAAGVESA